MAYQTGTATDQTDLMSKLNTFAAANGYTTDYYNGTNKFLALSRSVDNLYVTFAWDAINTIAMYQALGFSATYQEQPWNQANDSGNGSSTIPSQINRGRQVSIIGNGPFTKYYFFAYTNPHNIFVVLEFSPGLYRHFGFGKVAKNSTWTGGAWCAGHLWNWAGSTPFTAYATPGHNAHTVLMDGALSQGTTFFGTYNDNAGGTLHCEGLPGQAAASKWGTCQDEGEDDLYNDRAGNPRVRINGGCRKSVAIAQFGHFLPDLSNGFIPIIPHEIFYFDGDNGVNGWYYLGRMHNIGHITLQGIDPAQELTVGSDTWVAFPTVRKSDVGGTNQESENSGLIYKKVT
jgi:hypothetical protein